MVICRACSDGALQKSGAPWVSIVVCAVAWGVMLPVGFEKLIALDVILYGLSLALQFASLAFLRFYEPDLPRPFRVPGGKWGVALVGVAPVLLLLAALYHEGFGAEHSYQAIAIGGIVVLVGPVLYLFARPVKFTWRRGRPSHGPLTPHPWRAQRASLHLVRHNAQFVDRFMDADGCLGQLNSTASGFGGRDAPFEHNDATVFRLDLERRIDSALSQYSRA